LLDRKVKGWGAVEVEMKVVVMSTTAWTRHLVAAKVVSTDICSRLPRIPRILSGSDSMNACAHNQHNNNRALSPTHSHTTLCHPERARRQASLEPMRRQSAWAASAQ
jgi:hypothetical protein